MKTITFTPSEWELICDRLEEADAIAECLEHTWADDKLVPLYRPEDVFDRALTICREGQKVIDWNAAMDCDIIEDAILGSTVFCGLEYAILEGDVSKGKAMSIHKAAQGIEKKTGWEFPRD